MTSAHNRLIFALLCSFFLLLQPSRAGAIGFFEDFESGSWPAENEQQSTTQTIGDFIYGWSGCCSSNCCTTMPGSYWAYSTEQAHSGTHSLKIHLPRGISGPYPYPRIFWLGSDHGGVAFSKFSCGGWFYVPTTCDIADAHKFINLRFANGESFVFGIGLGHANGIWGMQGLDPYVYPAGAEEKLKNARLYLCNADGTRRFLTRGQWHHIKIHIELTTLADYNDTFIVWIDGEIAKFRYGAAGSEIDDPSPNVVDANLTDIEIGGDALTHMSWMLNQASGDLSDTDNNYIYWDDIFIENPGHSSDFQAPQPPIGVKAEVP